MATSEDSTGTSLSMKYSRSRWRKYRPSGEMSRCLSECEETVGGGGAGWAGGGTWILAMDAARNRLMIDFHRNSSSIKPDSSPSSSRVPDTALIWELRVWDSLCRNSSVTAFIGTWPLMSTKSEQSLSNLRASLLTRISSRLGGSCLASAVPGSGWVPACAACLGREVSCLVLTGTGWVLTGCGATRGGSGAGTSISSGSPAGWPVSWTALSWGGISWASGASECEETAAAWWPASSPCKLLRESVLTETRRVAGPFSTLPALLTLLSTGLASICWELPMELERIRFLARVRGRSGLCEGLSSLIMITIQVASMTNK